VLKRLFLFTAALLVTTDANAVAQKWTSKTSAAQQDYVDGVNNTSKDPTQLAINNQQRLLTNFTAAVNSGKWANKLRAVGKAGWQAAVDAKASNFSTGVNAATQKVATAFAPLLQFENNLQQQVDSMPNVTDTDRENRMLAWVRGMRTYSGA
jgi:hypothetical protein